MFALLRVTVPVPKGPAVTAPAATARAGALDVNVAAVALQREPAAEGVAGIVDDQPSVAGGRRVRGPDQRPAAGQSPESVTVVAEFGMWMLSLPVIVEAPESWMAFVP